MVNSEIYELEMRLNNSKKNIIIDFYFDNKDFIPITNLVNYGLEEHIEMSLSQGYTTNISYTVLLEEDCIRIKFNQFLLVMEGHKKHIKEESINRLFSKKTSITKSENIYRQTYKTIFDYLVFDFKVSVLEKSILELDDIITEYVKTILSKEMTTFFKDEIKNLKETSSYTSRGHEFKVGGSFGEYDYKYIREKGKNSIGFDSPFKMVFSYN